MSETILVWCGALSYGASTGSFLWAAGNNRGKHRIPYIYLVLGVVLLAIALSIRWIRIEQGPFMTLYEVLLSNAFSIGLIYALIFYFVPLCRYGSVVILPFLFMMTLWAVRVPADPVPLPATFDNPLLWLHVITGKLFLGFCTAATGLAGILLLNRFRLTPGLNIYVNQLSRIDSMIWRLMSVAFIADSCMLVVGSAWAYDAWGRYWAWDPLETWALMTWITLGACLHVRLTFRIPEWSGWVMVIFVFILAFLTFFGVPFLSLAPHKGIL